MHPCFPSWVWIVSAHVVWTVFSFVVFGPLFPLQLQVCCGRTSRLSPDEVQTKVQTKSRQSPDKAQRSPPDCFQHRSQASTAQSPVACGKLHGLEAWAISTTRACLHMGRVRKRALLDFVWKLSGSCLGFAWTSCGLCLGFAWALSGLSWDIVWTLFGLCVGLVWT